MNALVFYQYGCDLQAALPCGLCEICGREIYTPGNDVCRHCREKESFSDEED